MDNCPITTDEAARCLTVLQKAGKPMTAIELADQLGIHGNHESKRRRIRLIVKHLRDDCVAKIVATMQDGYYLTSDEKLWKDYLDGRQIDAKRIIGETAKQKKMVTDSSGQGMLFVLRWIAEFPGWRNNHWCKGLR